MTIPRELTMHARIRLRRAVALALTVAATGGVLLLAFGDDDEQGGERARPAGLSTRALAEARALTPLEQVDQVLMGGFDGTDATAPIVSEARDHQLGAILVGRANWPDAIQGAALVGELRAAGRSGGRVPPLIAVSQEGGAYRDLADLPPQGRQLEIGDAGRIDGAQAWARESSAALGEAGFDLNLSPVADVATLDSPVADRAFSDDAEVAAALTGAAIRGCLEAGIACAPLHFPGLGATSQDTNDGPATVSLDAASLEARDLQPFRAAFAEGAQAVVLSLALYPAYNAVTPAALAEEVADGLLREGLGFGGVAITDDLEAGAVRAADSVPAAALRALAAGADMVQISAPEDVEPSRQALLRALETGQLDPDRLATAVARVLELKRKLGLLD